MNALFRKILLPLIALILFAAAMVTHSPAGGPLGAENPGQNAALSTALWVLGIAALCGWLFSLRQHLTRALSGRGSSGGGASFGSGAGGSARRGGLNVLLVLLLLAALGYLTSRARFNATYDASRNQVNTLSPQTLKVIDSYGDRTVQVTGFFQNDILGERFKALLSLYQSAGLSIEARYYDPEADPAEAIAARITNANTAVISLGDKENRMTAFTEERLTNSLIAVLKEKTAKIYFTQGHGEGQLSGQNANDFDLIAGELKGNKYELASFSIMDGIPADADLIIIAGMTYDLKAAELAPLKAYLKSGKPLLALVDALVPVSRLNALLSEFGVHFADDFLMLRSDDQRAQLLGTQNAIVSQFDKDHPVTKDFAPKDHMALLMPYSRSVVVGNSRVAGINTSAIARTADGVVAITKAKSQRSLKSISPDRIATGPFDVIAVSSGILSARGEEAKASRSFRLIAAGSSRFATNQGAQRAEHRDMLLNMVNYLVQDDDFIAIRPHATIASTLTIVNRSAVIVLALLCFVYPFLILGAGAFYNYRRRRASS